MNQKRKALLALFLLAAVLFTGCSGVVAPLSESPSESYPAEEPVSIETTSPEEAVSDETDPPEEAEAISESGEYTSKEEVAAYLHEFGHLPPNYITKKEAQDLGWVSKEGNLSQVAPGKSIGGDRFGNYEGLLPEAPGRRYTECDIDFDGTYRNSKRIVFSNDGLIFYTEDHYESFELLYGEE